MSLVSIGGKRIIRGGNNICDGAVDRSDPAVLEAVMQRLSDQGFQHEDGSANSSNAENEAKRRRLASGAATSIPAACDGLSIPRALYARMYGPTTGDVVRLADSALFIRVESDRTVYGDECKFGGGKVLREGMGQATGLLAAQQLDTVITNALIVDYTGIYKADVGIKDGRIAGIGKAGNPDVMEGVSPNMICGVNTEAIAVRGFVLTNVYCCKKTIIISFPFPHFLNILSIHLTGSHFQSQGEGLILTAGGMDSHVHFICPQICDEALASGLTCMLGGGTGPASGTCATTCTPGPNHMRMVSDSGSELIMNHAGSR